MSAVQTISGDDSIKWYDFKALKERYTIAQADASNIVAIESLISAHAFRVISDQNDASPERAK